MSIFKTFLPVAVCLLGICGSLQAADITDKSTGITFPQEVTVTHDGKDYQLEAVTESTVKKLIVKVYSVAGYLDKNAVTKGGDIYEKLLDDQYPRQIIMKWVRDVPVDKIHDTYNGHFQRLLSESERASIANEINKFNSFFQNESVNDETTIRWFPGGYIEVLQNNKSVGSITNSTFAKTLISIWFGPKGVVNKQESILH